jgi:hypothetical protein
LQRQEESGRAIERSINHEFREVVLLAMLALVVTGVLLTFDRLSTNAAGPAYVATLGVKVALAIWMFLLVQGLGRRARRLRFDAVPEGGEKLGGQASPARLVLVLGLLVLLLADLLGELYEAGLRG